MDCITVIVQFLNGGWASVGGIKVLQHDVAFIVKVNEHDGVAMRIQVLEIGMVGGAAAVFLVEFGDG